MSRIPNFANKAYLDAIAQAYELENMVWDMWEDKNTDPELFSAMVNAMNQYRTLAHNLLQAQER